MTMNILCINERVGNEFLKFMYFELKVDLILLLVLEGKTATSEDIYEQY